MDGRQGTDYLRRLRPAQAFAVHYDDYRVFRSPIEEWVGHASEAGFGSTTYVPSRGETVAWDG